MKKSRSEKMENKHIIILIITIIIAAGIIGMGCYFAIAHNNTVSNDTEINATNTTNTTENTSIQSDKEVQNANQKSSSNTKTVAKDSSSSNSGEYDEDIDLSEKAGYDLHVNVHHNGDGSKSWTDAEGSHNAPDDKELVF